MRVLRWVGGFVAVALVAAVLFVAFGLNLLRGPIERKVSELTGRELRIEGNLEPVWSREHPSVRAGQVSFANPEWAAEDLMLSADVIEASVELPPLLHGQIYLPEVHLVRPRLDLEVSADGRRNWILGRDPEPKGERASRFHIGALTFDEGRLRYDDAVRLISIVAQLSNDREGLTAFAQGIFRGAGASAAARGDPVLRLEDARKPYALHFVAELGDATFEGDGSITDVLQLAKVDLAVELSGETLAGLRDVVGVALPAKGRYRTHGRLVRADHSVRYQDFTARVGGSDLAGSLQFDLGTARPRTSIRGNVSAKVLDLADLGNLAGARQPGKSRLLPDTPLEPERWRSIEADVSFKAATIKRPQHVPIEGLAVRARMHDRVLSFDPLELDVAGGKLGGRAVFDGSREPIAARLDIRIQHVSLAKLFQTLDKGQASLGDINGLIELTGRGDSPAQMLGTASGKLGAFIDGGKVSRALMQLAALNLWGVAKSKLRGDEPVEMRCAIGDFALENGVMSSNALILDTEVVSIQGGGQIDLKKEGLDLTLKPEPRERRLASLKSPLYIRGTFSAPQITVDKSKLATSGLKALGVAAINPVLAVMPLMRKGGGENGPCQQLIAEATPKPAAEKPSSSAGRSAPSGGR